jgi:hypothetical protein
MMQALLRELEQDPSDSLNVGQCSKSVGFSIPYIKQLQQSTEVANRWPCSYLIQSNHRLGTVEAGTPEPVLRETLDSDLEGWQRSPTSRNL